MIFAKAVSEPIYDFAQMVFANNTERMKKTPFSHSVAQRFLQQLEQATTLSVKDALLLPEPESRVLYELLTQYIIFLTMFADLPFPPDFLDGTDDLRLGSSLLNYFAERKFPFPQTLPQ